MGRRIPTIPVSLRMPVENWDIVEEEANTKGLTPEMVARSVLCEHFKVKK